MNALILKLAEALNNPIWMTHKIGDCYTMDGEPGWKIAYYPIFEDGKTGEAYAEPKALVEKQKEWSRKSEGGKTEIQKGTDFREVPLRYLNSRNT
jgi:hypothetical protein